MALDLTMDELFDKKIKTLRKTCPVCKTTFYSGSACPKCGEKAVGGHEYFEDPTFEEYAKEVEEANKPFAKKTETIKWEEVPDDELLPL